MDEPIPAVVSPEDLIATRDRLIEELCDRAKTPLQRYAIDDSIASVYLTSHLVCQFVGKPDTAIGATMNLGSLADRIRADVEPVARQFRVRTIIETFGDTRPMVADARWMLALWSLSIDVITSTTPDCTVEVNIGVCRDRFEIEVGHDESPRATGGNNRGGEWGPLPHPLTALWLRHICPRWQLAAPACPLGGRAVQVSIPALASETEIFRRAAA
jgi:hypothetical protein